MRSVKLFFTSLLLAAAMGCSTSVPQQETYIQSNLDKIDALAVKNPMMASQFQMKKAEFKQEFERLRGESMDDKAKIDAYRALNRRINSYITEFTPKAQTTNTTGSKLQPQGHQHMQPINNGTPGMAPGMRPGMNPGMAPGGMKPGMNPGMAPGGMNPGMAPGGMVPGGTVPGTAPGMAPGGVRPGFAPGMAPGGTAPGMVPGGMKPGMAPGMAPVTTAPGMFPGGTMPGAVPGGKLNTPTTGGPGAAPAAAPGTTTPSKL